MTIEEIKRLVSFIDVNLNNIRQNWDGRIGGAKIHDYNCKVGLTRDYIVLTNAWIERRNEEKSNEMYYKLITHFDNLCKYLGEID